MRYSVFVLLFVYLVKFTISSANYVPFFMWTNIRNENCVPDVTTYPGELIVKFTESEYMKCLQKTNPQKVKLYIMKELDSSYLNFLKKNQNSFKQLQTILESNPSVVLPAVQPTNIASLIEVTMKEKFAEAEVTTDELPTITHAEDVVSIDNMIADDYSKLEKFQYIAFLIVESTLLQRDLSNTRKVGRQLLATEAITENVTNETEFIGTPCIYMSYQNATLFIEKKSINLTSPTKISDDCAVTNTTRMVKISFLANGNSTDKVNLTLKFEMKNFPVSNRAWWFMQEAELTHDLMGDEVVSYSLNHTEQYTAPLGWSWVCAAPVTLIWRNNKKEIVQQLRFQNLQIQPFDITNSTFSHATDCSGILSGPIWSGTVMSLLLAAIFAFGLAMMASVSTMDRFDDPRGKPLMVHTHEAGN